MITAYKFLGMGAIGLYSGFGWPVPGLTEPGAWIEVEGPLEPGANGVHACGLDELVNWIDDELWLVELADPVEERESVILARRGRLLRRVKGWNAASAHAFVESCVLSAREAAVSALRRTGDERGALALAELQDLDALETCTAAAAGRASGFAAEALAYVADAAELAHGGRPEQYGFHPAAAARPTPASKSATKRARSAPASAATSARIAGSAMLRLRVKNAS